MIQVGTNELILAVMDETNSESPRLLGTCFSIGKGLFVTAGHVAESLRESKRPSLRKFETDGQVKPFPVQISESWGNVDFGIIKASDACLPAISWLNSRIVEPTNIYTIGFAFGLDIRRRKISRRHFHGHIVSSQKYASWQELDETRTPEGSYPFWTYELSFACPLCQSGSPLFAKLPDNTTSVVGIVIGNSKSKIEVLSNVEEESNGSKTETYKSVDLLHLGQAISSISLLRGESILLANYDKLVPDESNQTSLSKFLGKDLVRNVELQ